MPAGRLKSLLVVALLSACEIPFVISGPRGDAGSWDADLVGTDADTPDAGEEPGPDAETWDARAGRDARAAGEDAAPPGEDAAAPGEDAATPGEDAAAPDAGPAYRALVVDTAADTVDGVTSSIDELRGSPGADGLVSLREAILACNQTPNLEAPDHIAFSLPAGVRTIALGSELPHFTDPVFVDGSTQPGCSPGPCIELDGASAGASAHGLVLADTADASTVRGLALNRFGGHGLLVRSTGNTIVGNHLGLALDGTTARGNTGSGLYLLDAAQNVIGGRLDASFGERNVLGANGVGITLDGLGCVDNLLTGNLIGLDGSGRVARPNKGAGVLLRRFASRNTIGSTTVGRRNVISGNSTHGIHVQDANTIQTVIIGNYLGTDLDNSDTPLGNGGCGVYIGSGPTGTLIGGATVEEGNTVRFNATAGVRLTSGTGTRHAVLGNALYQNGGIDLDLGSDGVTNNDPSDSDVGTNDLLNHPVPVSTSYAGGSVTVVCTLDTLPGTYRLEFFATKAPATSGHGGGERRVHAMVVTNSGSGAQPYSATFPMDASEYLTATVTQNPGGGDSYGATSEFSLTVPTTYP